MTFSSTREGSPSGKGNYFVPRQKLEAEQLAGEAIQVVAAAGREPDAWEALHLGEAIEAIAIGYYALATKQIALARSGPEQAGHWPRVSGTLTVQALRNSLEEVRQLPLVIR